ncbi:hypothetical protein DM02DRAFT_660338 [Periconia macrospinosa]|uniref:Uncharacterized protein n=1 Tax=Periconia macrospinosa TaxID=97972 RepID=A0A2V1DB17_9PLEO|nr:hypothetical protein DM02DRAFT_660338 [Periconia macrospinosa]
MSRCKICLTVDDGDIAPAASCIRRAFQYLNLSQHVLEKTLSYFASFSHLMTCDSINRELEDFKDGHSHISKLLGLRPRERAELDKILRKNLSSRISTAGTSLETSETIICPDLMPCMQAIVGVPGSVSDFLENLDKRLSDQCGEGCAQGDVDAFEYKLASFALEMNEIQKGNAFVEQLEAVKGCVSNVIEMRAAAECSNLTRSICASNLPREVRDIIYGYLVFDEQTLFLDGPLRLRKKYNKHHRHFYPFDWVFDPRFMAENMAEEIAQTYYSKHTFAVQLAEDIPTLLISDWFGNNIQPFRFIRRLYLFYKIRDMNHGELRKLHHALEPLNLITHKDTLRFYLDIRSESDDKVYGNVCTLNLLEALRKPIYDLKHSGSRIWIIHERHMNSWARRTILDCKYTKEDADTGFFNLTQERWVEEQAIVGSCDPDPTAYYVDETTDPALVQSRLEDRWGITEDMQGVIVSQYYVTCKILTGPPPPCVHGGGIALYGCRSWNCRDSYKATVPTRGCDDDLYG